MGLLTPHQSELSTTDGDNNSDDNGESGNESSHMRLSYGVDSAVGNERLSSDSRHAVWVNAQVLHALEVDLSHKTFDPSSDAIAGFVLCSSDRMRKR